MIRYFCLCYLFTLNIGLHGEALYQYSHSLIDGLDAFSTEAPDTRLHHIHIQHAPIDDIKHQLERMFSNAIITSDAHSSVLSIMCTDKEWTSIEQLVSKWDIKKSLIKLSFKVIELSNDLTLTLDGPASSLFSGIGVTYDTAVNRITFPRNFYQQIDILEKEGKAKLVAKPSVLLVDGGEGSIYVGDRIPYVNLVIHNSFESYQVHYADTGLHLSISAAVTSPNMIQTNLKADIISVKQWIHFERTQYPILSTRRTDTQLRLQNGETVVISGLIDNQNRSEHNGIPILKDIPIIGNLFGFRETKTQKTDLAFILTAEIINQEE